MPLQESAYVLLKFGRLWQHQQLESHSRSPQCGLTPRSRRGPTAGHQGPVGGTRYIFANRALASCRWSRLSSNVRPHTNRYRWLAQHREQPVPRTVQVQLSRFGNVTAKTPVLARTALANVRAGSPSLGFYMCASRQLAGAVRLLASVSSWNHRPSMVSPSFSGVQGGGIVSASAAPATARFGGLKMAALWPVMNQFALGRVRPNPSFKPSPNGVPRGPDWRYAVHFRHPGPRVTPLVPA